MPNVTDQLKVALVDRYLIEGDIGEGGMATVYLAHDVKHNRKVALKVLRPELAAVIGAERFLKEIEVTANLQHPHILPLHDSGTVAQQDGGPEFLFYVMPYVEGESLRDKLDREKQLGIDDAIDIARSVAAALDYAHRKKIIHRDIKPENILLHDGQALVADFGIALAVSAASGTRLTETGLSIGTPHYMSPEQAMGDRELDARSDVYSLGAMLYEMLTGDPPYQGSTAQAIVAKVITEKAPPVTAVRDTVPPHVAASIHKSLNKLPADRFASAAGFADALTRPGAIPITTAGEFVEAGATTGVRGLNWKVMIPVAAVVAMLAGAVGWWISPDPPAPQLTRFTVPVAEGVVGVGFCCSTGLRLSPDGTRLVYVGNVGGETNLYLRSMSRLETTEISGTEGARSPFFSPDGRWIGFLAGGELKKVALAGGPPIKIADAEAGRIEGASWGEGDVIVFARNNHDALWRVPAAGGVPEVLLAPDSGFTGEFSHPDVLPGGQKALFTLFTSLEAARIGVVTLETGDTTMLATGTQGRYAHPGQLIYTGADGSLLVRPFDPDQGQVTGDAVAILDGVNVRGNGTGEFDVSRSGSLVFLPGGGATGGNESLVFVDRGGAVDEIRPGLANYEDPALSPDGSRVAVTINDGSELDIWIYDIEQGTTTRLTFGGGQYPRWTPDGERVVFSSNRTGSWEVYSKSSDFSGPAESVFGFGGFIAPNAVTSDGQYLVATVFDSTLGLRVISLVDSGDARTYAHAQFNHREAALSPDDAWLAYVTNETGRSEVYVSGFPEPGRKVQVSTNGGAEPMWSPDGRELFFLDGAQEMTVATVELSPTFRVTSRASLFETAFDTRFPQVSISLHPDGERFAALRVGTAEFGAAPELVVILNWYEEVRRMTTGN